MRKVYTGCDAKFKINGVEVGYATSVSMEGIVDIDAIKAVELESTKTGKPIKGIDYPAESMCAICHKLDDSDALVGSMSGYAVHKKCLDEH